jgi:hypothetical protein
LPSSLPPLIAWSSRSGWSSGSRARHSPAIASEL